LQIATDCTSSSVPATAKAQGVSNQTVRRSLPSAAYATLLSFGLICEIVLGDFAIRPPTFFSCHPQWDGTRERLGFRINGRTIVQSVEVFVLILVMTWGWADGPPHIMEAPLTPVPSPGTDWESTRNCIQNSYYGKIFWNYALQMSAYATSSLKLRFGTRDAASGNLKYCAVERSELQALGIWSDYTDCLNHQCMLGFLACMFAVFATEFLHAVNSLTIFLNCHTHRLRMVISIEQYLKAEGRVVLWPGSPPAIDVAYAKECISYFSRWGVGGGGKIQQLEAGQLEGEEDCSVV